MNYLLSLKDSNILQNGGDRPQLGVGYLASAMKAANYDVRILDLNHQSIWDIDNPEMIGLSFTTPLRYNALRIARTLRDVFPTAVLVGGGAHISNVGKDEGLSVFDYVVKGEGELAILQILSEDVEPGIVIGERLSNLDDIPLIDRRMYPMGKYGLKLNGELATPILTSRGCPNHCVYCGKGVSGDRVRFHSAEYVVNEIESVVNQFGIKSFIVYDDVFTANPKRIKRIKDLLKERNLSIKYRATTRANMLSSESVDDLVESGCVELCFGIESGNDEILKNVGKNLTVKKNREAVSMAKSAGMKVKGYFIIGLPGETEETARQTIWLADNLGLDEADFYSLIPFPGTRIYDEPESLGLSVKDYSFNALQTGKPVMKTKDLNIDTIYKLIEEAKRAWQK